MSAVFSATWQSFRFGLQASPAGRAALSALRSVCTPRQPKHPFPHFRGIHRFPKVAQGPLGFQCAARLCISLHLYRAPLRQQSKWVNLWKRTSEPALEGREEDAEVEISLTEDEVKKIFGKSMHPQEGIDVLMTLQKHRLEGTLDHKMAYPDTWINKGLTYLRTRFPFDEDAAIIERIDREMKDNVWRPQSGAQQSPSAVSQFDKLRRENKEKAELERQKNEAEKRRAKSTEALPSPKMVPYMDKKFTTPSNAVRLRSEPEWIRKYRVAAEEKEVPDISTARRLVPSAIVVTIVLGLSVLFAQYYKPPSRKARLWPEIPPAAATTLAIIGINVLIWFLWKVPPLWKNLHRSFMVVPLNPHASSMIGAAWSHQDLAHLLANMAGVWLVGTRLHDDVGRGPFLALYFSAAAIAGLVPMTVYVLKGILVTSTVGASGALTALLAALCVLHEGQTVTLSFLPPEWTRGIDTGVLLALFILLEFRQFRKRGLGAAKTNFRRPPTPETITPVTDHMGHLSGYATGIVAACFIRERDPKWRNVKREHWYTYPWK